MSPVVHRALGVSSVVCGAPVMKFTETTRDNTRTTCPDCLAFEDDDDLTPAGRALRDGYTPRNRA